MIEIHLEKLLLYGLQKEFFAVRDIRYIRNRLQEVLSYSGYKGVPVEAIEVSNLEDILNDINIWAVNCGIIAGDNPTATDILQTALIGAMFPRPTEVTEKFYSLYEDSPRKATDYLYNLSLDANYIRLSRNKQNLNWRHRSAYGTIEITINVAKPEKTVAEIEATQKTKQNDYPRCLLCAENEGYMGRFSHPARQNLRLIPLKLTGEQWYLQYSPYQYYREHCIALNEKHIPMVINQKTIEKLLDFIDLFPHYFIGSNADLPVVGGSILNHDHFQGGCHRFAIDEAEIIQRYIVPEHRNVNAAILKWPLSVIRLWGPEKASLLEVAGQVLSSWLSYSNEEAGLIPYSKDGPHSTLTPLARMENGYYRLDLALRNNRRDVDKPLAIFHPPEELHNIKKENIGLIEVMGLAILPGRLLNEMELMKKYLRGDSLSAEEENDLQKHLLFCEEIRNNYRQDGDVATDGTIKKAIGDKFVLSLQYAGVFKDDHVGRNHFRSFMASMGWQEDVRG